MSVRAGALLAGYSTAVALTRGPLQWILAAPLALVPLLSWILRSPDAWLLLFFAVAFLAPPLPVALGNSGPHPALLFAALGVVVGFLRAGEWRFWRGLLPGVLIFFFAMLAISTGMAAVYSGPQIAAGSLARVGLAGISLWVFFYVAMGPGRMSEIRIERVYWIALASAAFACLDFYYQFPAPAGFGAQYIWLSSGIYRRAQGLFYEASTLGNFCAFFLVMTAVALVRGVANRLVLILGGAVFAAALIFSYSRSSVANVAIALVALALLERKRPAVRWVALLGMGSLAVLVVILFRFFPAYAALYWTRLQASVTFALSSNEVVLSGRVESWRTLAQFLIDHPWHLLLGVGYKTLPYSDFIGERLVADNMYFSILVETGIFGLAALVVLNFAIVRAGYRAARSNDAQKSFFGAWIFCFWIAEAVQMLSADLLTFWRVLPVYLWVLAMAVRR
jgi:O-antigen ligase